MKNTSESKDISGRRSGSFGSAPRRSRLTPEEYVEGVLAGDRVIVGRAITLVESNAPAHQDTAREVLKRLVPRTGNAMRVGITGIPGVGKSTFIEALGGYLLEEGHFPAVLAVDPTSARTGGSILGDKTRMERLARDKRCFIRPSPSGGTLGGVARKTRETILILEAAGYDVILVETVGVGQSEITVRSMVDFFLLLMLAGAGDELQGIKRGVFEIADAVLINKADGDNKVPAERARGEFQRALMYLTPAVEGWRPDVYTGSASTGEGIPEIWNVVTDFREKTMKSGGFEARRRSQKLEWIQTLVDEHLRSAFYQHEGVAAALPGIEAEVAAGNLPPGAAVTRLIDIYEGKES
jgi:LAO/AO transport system kinase